MRKETRLARLEEEFPEPPLPRPEIELMHFMSLEELDRLDGIVKRIEGDEGVTNAQDLADCKKIYASACERQLAGWSRDQIDRLDGKNAWGLIFALRGRHDRVFFTSLCHGEVLDALDVTAAEFEGLIQLVTPAASTGDLLPYADVIGRLRICSRPLDVATFADLVFDGRMPHGAPHG